MPAAHARSASLAADPVSQFFAQLARPGHLSTFEGESATLRFELVDGDRAERWFVTVNDGEVTVTHRGSPAAASVRIQRRDFEAIVTGRRNAQAALLRGLMSVEGDFASLMMFQRCLPGPPGSTGRVEPITSEMVMAKRRAS
jgi:predicted lipid carrier protein YhbT